MADNTDEHPRRAPDPRRRSQRARNAILDAAAELLGEVGYAKLTVEAIASRARVGKQTIYRWWPSKAAVVFDVFTRVTGAEAGVPLPDTGDLAADLTTVLRATADEFGDPTMDRTIRAFTAEIQHDEEFARAVHERFTKPNLDAFRDRLRAARDAGQIRSDVDLDLAVEMLNGPVQHRWLLRTGPLDHAYADALVEAVLRALRP
ncbi:TetR/AcrR family transcriptional regulator [Nocardiopsis sp. MG754419]|uniref:TetR/AcrR family transcriptional regulator n=1 Tax=Nocardiopsis sp. MG754419 TaxID=2259865 RepID=UPI001BA976D8|nr:TetR/AcrR family transcriptional regulator [Nocardiopsis sp. MG754419]MBR8741127.1 TetR family transcriptional regulator [Nocardiopsis sp. MG754419]